MIEVRTIVPKWVLIVSGIFALLEIMVSLLLLLMPQEVVEKVDLDAEGAQYLIYMWAVRQFALGFIFAFATFKKSVPMLTLTYIFFLVMFVGDFFIGISLNENILIISAIVMSFISLGLIYVLNGRKQ